MGMLLAVMAVCGLIDYNRKVSQNDINVYMQRYSEFQMELKKTPLYLGIFNLADSFTTNYHYCQISNQETTLTQEKFRNCYAELTNVYLTMQKYREKQQGLVRYYSSVYSNAVSKGFFSKIELPTPQNLLDHGLDITTYAINYICQYITCNKLYTEQIYYDYAESYELKIKYITNCVQGDISTYHLKWLLAITTTKVPECLASFSSK